MARACECESCGALFKPVKDTVSLTYSICNGGNSYRDRVPADESGDEFYLCLTCSATFLTFIKDTDADEEGSRPHTQRDSCHD